MSVVQLRSCYGASAVVPVEFGIEKTDETGTTRECVCSLNFFLPDLAEGAVRRFDQ